MAPASRDGVHGTPTAHRKRVGFTLIEVLVVLGIIGLLMGLLLPAVQSAHESARRAQCIGNLKQFGVALGAYESVHHMFPASQLTGASLRQANLFSGHSFLLPYLDQQPLHAAINFQFAEYEYADLPTLENRTARNTRLAVFLCPSDGEPRHLNSYRFNRGLFAINGPTVFDGPFSIGVLPSHLTITDGLSRTAFVSERIGGSFVAGGRGWPRDIKVVEWRSDRGADDAAFDAHCEAVPPADWTTNAGRYWLYSGLDHAHYNHGGRPNDPRPSCWPGGHHDTGRGFHPPRSFHPGLVHVLMGDGHVEPAFDTIAMPVWAALGTRSGKD